MIAHRQSSQRRGGGSSQESYSGSGQWEVSICPSPGTERFSKGARSLNQFTTRYHVVLWNGSSASMERHGPKAPSSPRANASPPSLAVEGRRRVGSGPLFTQTKNEGCRSSCHLVNPYKMKSRSVHHCSRTAGPSIRANDQTPQRTTWTGGRSRGGLRRRSSLPCTSRRRGW